MDSIDVVSTHWADLMAKRIVRERGEKNIYVCASGITPSGTVHIGNFREIISVDLVARALKDRGRKVRFIYSWDDYDVFRAVPANMPKQELLATYLRKPITLVPDVLGNEQSYAAHNEKALEEILPLLGIEPEYIYQAECYRSSRYAEGMKKALDHREDIRGQLNAHRSAPLPEDWYPLSVFCASCDRDTTRVSGWDGDYAVSYVCDSCGNHETVDLRSSSAVKLPWRIDWPMRWWVESVDFEPAGKDHHSEGGSFDTARLTSKEVFGIEPPLTFQYDFVRIKGGSGKMSSSSGEVISLADVLLYYQPELVRFLFASTRPNSEFAISFDLDVLKNYEDYDRVERSYFNRPENPKKLAKWKRDARVYELSQVHEPPTRLPYQIQIRHLATLLQIHSGDIEGVISWLGDVPEADVKRLRSRSQCAWNWVRDFSPEDFRFSLRRAEDDPVPLPKNLSAAVGALGVLAGDALGEVTEKEFGVRMYQLMHEHGLESPEFFTAVYRAIIGKDRGPRLVSFLHILGKKRVLNLLQPYIDMGI